MSKKWILIGIGILALAVFLRLTNLNNLSIFADEAIYIRWSQVMKAESTLRFLPLSDGKQPLYMWAVIPFLKFINDPLLAGRLLSAMAGLGTVVGVGLASYMFFLKPKIAFIASLLWAVLPYALFFERMALADAMLTMWIVWGVFFFGTAVKKVRLDLAMCAGFLFGFAWLTKSPALIALLLLPTLFFIPRDNKITKKVFLKFVGLYIACFAIAFGMYNILRLGPEFHMIALRNKDYIFPLSEVIKHPLDPFISHAKDTLSFLWYLLTPLGLVVCVAGLFQKSKTDKIPPRWVVWCWFLLPILGEIAIARQFTARYILFTIPFAVMLIAEALERAGNHSQKHIVTLAMTAGIVVPSLWMDSKMLTNYADLPLPRIERSGYLEQWTAGVGLKEISQQLVEKAKNGPVVVGSEGFFGTPFDALKIYTNNIPQIRVVGVGVWIDSVHESLQQAKKENQTFLVVNSSRFHVANPEKIGLKLIGSYPKAVQPNQDQEFTLFFEVQK